MSNSDRLIYFYPINIELYRNLKPYLEQIFGFNEIFINEVFSAVYSELPIDEREKKSFSQFREEDNYEIKVDIFDPTDLLNSIERYNANSFILYPLFIMTHIYIKFKGINAQQLDFEDNSYTYIDDVRPDMLKLYNFINDWSKEPFEKPITLICGSKKLVLNNKKNWMFTAINNYLKTYLNVDSVNQATEELETKYTLKSGKKINKYQSIFMSGIDSLYRILTESDEITNDQCCIIRDILKYLGEPISDDDFDDADDIKNIRSRLRYLRNKEYTPNWEIPDLEDLPPAKAAYW